jgi:predicted transcriptional regulator
MRNRSRTEIISHILEAANGTATKMKIMYSAYLNHNQMKEYLVLLTEKDLIRYDKDTGTFKTTEKGLGFLHAYHQIRSMIKERQSSQQQKM